MSARSKPLTAVEKIEALRQALSSAAIAASAGYGREAAWQSVRSVVTLTEATRTMQRLGLLSAGMNGVTEREIADAEKKHGAAFWAAMIEEARGDMDFDLRRRSAA
ncbi:MAG TPA: hypothetical protein VLH12_08455 [Usitatibacter sp.]|nr:hypothetical protein [Usitatibacter sp.]